MTKTELMRHNRVINRLEKGLERARVITALDEGVPILDIAAWSFMSQSWVYRVAREHEAKKKAEEVQRAIEQAIEDYKKQANTIQV